MSQAALHRAWFYKDLFPVTPKLFQSFRLSLQSHLQLFIPLLDLQHIVMDYARHRFQGQTKSSFWVGKASRYMAMTVIDDTLFIADGGGFINGYEFMCTDAWQRTGFWRTGSTVTQLGTYGKHLVSSDYKGEGSVWDPSNGKLVRKFTGHTGRVMVFAEVHGMLATCSYDKTVRFWTLSQSSEVDRIVFRSSLPTCMVACDGKLVVGDSRANLQVFDREDGVWTCILTFGGFAGQLTSLVVSSRSLLLCVVNRCVYSMSSAELVLRGKIYTDCVDNYVCVADDLLVIGYHNRIALHANDGPLIRHLTVPESVRGRGGMVAVGGRLAVASTRGFVTFFD